MVTLFSVASDPVAVFFSLIPVHLFLSQTPCRSRNTYLLFLVGIWASPHSDFSLFYGSSSSLPLSSSRSDSLRLYLKVPPFPQVCPNLFSRGGVSYGKLTPEETLRYLDTPPPLEYTPLLFVFPALGGPFPHSFSSHFSLP